MSFSPGDRVWWERAKATVIQAEFVCEAQARYCLRLQCGRITHAGKDRVRLARKKKPLLQLGKR